MFNTRTLFHRFLVSVLCSTLILSARAEVLRLSDISITTNRQVALGLSTQPGQAYDVEWSSNLVQWQILSGTTATSNRLEVLDTETVNSPGRFYRARLHAATNVPNPITVTAEFDTNRSGYFVMPITKSACSIADTNGLVYTLSFPSNALLSFENVRMTVITNINELPLNGGFIGGVKIEPEGLRLLQPATLTIQGVNAGSNSLPLGFAFQGTGEQFHPHPMTMTNHQAVMQIMRFASYGVGRGLASVADQLAERRPEDTELQLDLALAVAQIKGAFSSAAVSSHHSATLLSHVQEGSSLANGDAPASEPDLYEIMVSQFQQEFAGSILPNLQKAAGDDQVLGTALGSYAWWRQSAVQFAVEESLQVEIAAGNDAVVAAIENCIFNTSQECQDSHQLWLIRKLIQAGRLMENPYWSDCFDEGSKQTLRLDIRKCATFNVSWDSRTVLDTELGQIVSEVKVDTVSLDFGDGPLTSLHGQGYYDFVEVTYPPVPQITISANPQGSTLQILDVSMDLNPRLQQSFNLDGEQVPNSEIVKTMRIALNPNILAQNIPAENFTGVIPKVGTVDMGKQYWALAWATVHYNELVMPLSTYPGAYVVTDLDTGADDIVAKKDYFAIVTVGGHQASETTKIDLRHTPIP
ncbi:MAG: hypothetical protein M1608_07335 [Candidatus Omnitrophica bacterium]|nr:hypothetical protein [Candidatus Omnitrophota bacterium]